MLRLHITIHYCSKQQIQHLEVELFCVSGFDAAGESSLSGANFGQEADVRSQGKLMEVWSAFVIENLRTK